MTGLTLQHGQAGLPTPNSTRSFWHREPSETLLGHRTTERLPATADVVIVGSGITGTFAARELAAGGRRVLLLEAREACWGATGRNGGHCQPGVWNNNPNIARFELATFDFINDLVTYNDIQCDWEVVGGIHPFYSQEVLDAAEKQMKNLQRHPDLKDKAVLVDKDELGRYRVPDAIGAIYQPNAAKCWPYKLVAWVLERLLRDHSADEFNLQTNTPVTHLQPAGSSWIVHTARGQVAAKNVLLASNAYTPYLLPKMASVIVPVRGQVCALQPPEGATPLPHSYVWLSNNTDDYLIHYLIQRGSEDRGASSSSVDFLIFGGERLAVAGGQEGIYRDDELDPVIGQHLHHGLHSAIKLRPPKEDEESELRASYEWTGIMGFSRDSHPWVGPVPAGLGGVEDTPGLWVSAGYTGHGMPVAARCGVAVAEMILGREGGVELPEEFVVSEKRAEAARLMTLPRTMMDKLKMLAD
ncbi:oxidoreductase OrdL [Tolypocladium capitatum]|uniref:Oxidoreductase OrdL n=1 Tax=Tolypocladium capitatum TaxID=45235 RepID=A0A2K3QD04_9HYPO|nr:oxidoreductase OrdL [Tolypocladium capitatum]